MSAGEWRIVIVVAIALTADVAVTVKFRQTSAGPVFGTCVFCAVIVASAVTGILPL